MARERRRETARGEKKRRIFCAETWYHFIRGDSFQFHFTCTQGLSAAARSSSSSSTATSILVHCSFAQQWYLVDEAATVRSVLSHGCDQRAACSYCFYLCSAYTDALCPCIRGDSVIAFDPRPKCTQLARKKKWKGKWDGRINVEIPKTTN